MAAPALVREAPAGSPRLDSEVCWQFPDGNVMSVSPSRLRQLPQVELGKLSANTHRELSITVADAESWYNCRCLGALTDDAVASLRTTRCIDVPLFPNEEWAAMRPHIPAAMAAPMWWLPYSRHPWEHQPDAMFQLSLAALVFGRRHTEHQKKTMASRVAMWCCRGLHNACQHRWMSGCICWWKSLKLGMPSGAASIRKHKPWGAKSAQRTQR